MMLGRCDQCVNYCPTGKTGRYLTDGRYEDADRGQCRIGPPQPTPSVASDSAGRWPLVWADEWCGCFFAADRPALRLARPAGPDGAA